MFRRITAMSLSVTLGVVLTSAHAEEAPGAQECQTHFTVEGNFLSGKKYSTWVSIAGVAKTDAYTRVYSSVAKDGWNIVNADKDAGIISAAQSVSYGKGSQAPMVITIEAADKGSKVTATFRTGGAQMAKEETIRTKLCSYLGAASS